MLAEQNIEEYLPMPASTKGDFLLRVKGESMIDAGILDGDLVIVQRAQDARNGEIVVALAGDDESADEATVKTFYRERQANPAPARERVARADLRAPRPDPRPRRRGVPGALGMTNVARCTGRSTRSSSRCCAARRSSASSAASSSCTREAEVFCPECGSQLGDEQAFVAGARIVAAGRVTAARRFGGASRKVRTP